MRILIIGGTRFVGRALVETALARGHQITLFNRGQSNPDLYPDIETLHGDRDGDLDLLAGKIWDAVIDTCGYIPRVVRQSAQLLKHAVDQYVFISTLSVYADSSQPGLEESAPLAVMQDESIEEINGETYGPLKALCEAQVQNAYGDRALIFRPGLIVGPNDYTDRFPYWPWRAAQGGNILSPGRPQRPIQFIDARDMAEWVLTMVETQISGIFNVISPPGKWTMKQLLDTCVDVSGSQAHLVWVPDDFLLEHKVGAWMDMPFWIPESDPELAGFFAFDATKAQRAGLTYRNLEQTVRDTFDWVQSRPADHPRRAGIDRDTEQELLEKWWKTQNK